MRYIVTGGAGPGSNLADTLAQNHDVVIIDNLATRPAGRRSSISSPVAFIEGSITDLDLLMETFPGSDGIFGGHPVRAPVGRETLSTRGINDFMPHAYFT